MKKRTKRTLKMAFKVWGRMVMAGVMCAVMIFSFGTLANGLLSEEIGYRVIKTDPDATEFTADNSAIVREVYYEDGVEPPANEAIELGDGETLQRLYEMSHGMEIAVNIFVLLCSLFILGVFPYNLLWEMGSKDENKVRFGRSRYDCLRGLKIGALATLPSVLVYVLLILSRFDLFFENYLGIYRILTIPFLPYLNLITDTANMATDLNLWHFLGLLAIFVFIPLVCMVAYQLGYRQFSLKERFTYEKKDAVSEGEEI